MKEHPKTLEVPDELVPKEYKSAKCGGVFLVFVTGNNLQEVAKKVAKIEKLAGTLRASTTPKT